MTSTANNQGLTLLQGIAVSQGTIDMLDKMSQKLSPSMKTDPIKELVNYDPDFHVPTELEQEVRQMVTDKGIDITARHYGYMTDSYAHLVMAGRLLIERVLDQAPSNVIEYVKVLYHRLGPNVRDFIISNANELQLVIDDYHWSNYQHDFVSANSIINLYLSRAVYNGIPQETPTQMYMRVAVQLYHNDGLERVIKCFKELATMSYTMASPTLFNAGTRRPQMSSCFLVSIADNLDSIMDNAKAVAKISKHTGGLGIDVSEIRHSEIDYVGMSGGLVPMLKVFNEILRYVDQGGGKRKGACTIFLRPHHIDVFDFIKLVDPMGDHNVRAHDLNLCLWTPWLFWKRVEEDGDWTLFCPAKTKKLNQVYGQEFEKTYIEYEDQFLNSTNHGIVGRRIKARELLSLIITMQRRTGKPYLMNCDSANFKSPHKHIGYIRSSNLCLEIIEYTDSKTINVCNICSINLNRHVPSIHYQPPENLDQALDRIDFSLLGSHTTSCIHNLNRVIDNNFYPLDKDDGEKIVRGSIHRTNMKFRSVGLGVNGLSELLNRIDLPYIDPLASKVDEVVTACIYYNALLASVQLSITEGCCSVFEGSPYSQGKLQFDLWDEEYQHRWGNQDVHPSWSRQDLQPVSPTNWKQDKVPLYNKFGEVIDTVNPSWDDVKRVIVKYGMRNSLVLAYMPTASTAKTLRNSESTEVHIRNLYSVNLIHGSYPTLNRYMVSDLDRIGLWCEDTLQYLRASNGCLTGLGDFIDSGIRPFTNFRDCTPHQGDMRRQRLTHLENKYKTMLEIPQKEVIFRNARRGKYIDQSQSVSLFFEDATDKVLEASHRLSNALGNKTMMYYLHTMPPSDNAKLTVDPQVIQYVKSQKLVPQNTSSQRIACNDQVCLSCQ